MMIYVLGFAFKNNDRDVILIEKTKPDWQKGLLNGVGGKVESYDDTYTHAMVREFREETGIETINTQWQQFGEMYDTNFHIFLFRTSLVGDDIYPQQMEDEIPYTCDVETLLMSRDMCISNVPWLVNMALDKDIANTYFSVRYIR
jgi:8-oxo-dGTP diphosphatase